MGRQRGRPDARPVRPRPCRARRAVRQRVLIVEDEPALLRALRINLRARSYEVITAATGRPALTEATSGRRTRCCSTSACRTWTASR